MISNFIVHTQECYNKTILCENFTTDGNNCSSNIERFIVVQRAPGFVPQYEIQLILRHAVPNDTDVRVVTCSSPSECNIDNITADSFSDDSSCNCERLQPSRIRMPPLMRGIGCRCGNEEFCLEGTTILLFTQTGDCREEPANIMLIITMEGTSCLYEPHHL